MNERNKNNPPISITDMEQTTRNEQMGAQKIKRLDTPCRLHIRSYRHRLADADGISAKAAIDGLVHAGVLSDDSTKEVTEVSYSQEKIPKAEQEKTIITITTEGL